MKNKWNFKETWNKWRESAKDKWQNFRHNKNMPELNLSILPAIIVLTVAAVAILRYEPVAGQGSNLVNLLEQYEQKMNASLEAAEATTEAATKTEAQTFTDGVYKGTGTGFGGKITVQVTVEQQKITAIEVLSAPGEDSSFFNKAKGVIDSIIAAQNVEVDTITGATYSSRGIIAAVKNALYGTEDNNTTASSGSSSGSAGSTPTTDVPEDGYEDGTYTGTGTGFGGKIKVQVKIKNSKIKSIKILEASGETPSYLKKAKAVIKTIINKQTPNVSAVSGATYSSNGIIKAVQNALKKAAKTDSDEDDDDSKKEEDNTSDSTDNTDTSYQDGTYSGTGTGFRGTITVKVTIKDGKITAIEVTDGGKDDKAFLEKAKAIIETMIANQTADVDTATGATYSSKGIIEAVKNALKKAAGNSSGEESTNSSSTTAQNEQAEGTTSQTNSGTTAQTDSSDQTESGQTSSTESQNSSTEATQDGSSTTAATTASSESTTASSSKYKDGTYTGSAMGFGDTITVTITVSGGKVTKISVSAADPNEFVYDDEFKSALNKLAQKIVSNQSTDGISAVSGATYSSKGILNAAKKALNKALNE
ncbi:MAG: FMN-binding protein [Lachnospiraceae bacterium]|nr:FMN-binding protein [Lachnospiraceae bacterium]